MREWARPTVEKLQQMLDAGLSPAQIRARLLELLPDTQAISDGLHAALLAGASTAEPVQAARDCRAAAPARCRVHGRPVAWDSGTFTKDEKQTAIKKFAKTRKAKTAELFKEIGGKIKTPIPDIPTVKLNKSGIKEMLNNKALWASMNLGASVEVHFEAAERTRELVNKATPGKPIPTTAPNDPVKEKIYLDKQFTAKDGKQYTARYMVRVFKQSGMDPDIYFMNCHK